MEDDRSRFNFPKLVRSAFRFLETEYAFHIVKSDLTYVRYESDRVFVNIYHGRMSYYVGVEIGLLPTRTTPEPPYYPLQLILDVVNAPIDKELRYSQSSSPDVVEKIVARLGRYTKEYAKSALLGEPSIFDALKIENSKWFADYQLHQVKVRAESAWESKDYRKVAELYGSVQSHLTPTEEKRWEYAKKMLTVG